VVGEAVDPRVKTAAGRHAGKSNGSENRRLVMSAHPAGARPDREPIGGRAAGSVRHPLARALLVMTFTTGLVDAVSYLGLGRVFA
jgi:hypothetical protein